MSDENIKVGNTEETIKQLYYRLETMERKLRLTELTPEERTRLDSEISFVKDVLKKNEHELKELGKEYWKSGLVASVLIFICFLAYGIHAMFWR